MAVVQVARALQLRSQTDDDGVVAKLRPTASETDPDLERVGKHIKPHSGWLTRTEVIVFYSIELLG